MKKIKCKYTKNDIIEMIRGCEESKNIYKDKEVNYSSATFDTDEYVTEVISKFLLENLDLLRSIQTINRVNEYFVDDHNGEFSMNYSEPNIAKFLTKEQHEDEDVKGFGKILDYEVPLKNKQKDGAGKIDLLSIKGDTAYFLELKAPESKETLLRCVLEIYTYYNQADRDKLIKELNTNEKFIKDNETQVCKIVPAVLIFENSRQNEEYKMKDINIHIEKLRKELGVEVFILPNSIIDPFIKDVSGNDNK